MTRCIRCGEQHEPTPGARIEMTIGSALGGPGFLIRFPQPLCKACVTAFLDWWYEAGPNKSEWEKLKRQAQVAG